MRFELSLNVRRKFSVLQLMTKPQMDIAKAKRFTPRTANYLLKRCRDFAQMKKCDISSAAVAEAFKCSGIDELGLLHSDIKMLRAIAEKWNGGPVGVNTIATAFRGRRNN